MGAFSFSLRPRRLDPDWTSFLTAEDAEGKKSLDRVFSEVLLPIREIPGAHPMHLDVGPDDSSQETGLLILSASSASSAVKS
jgi:hypothetical protein